MISVYLSLGEAWYLTGRCRARLLRTHTHLRAENILDKNKDDARRQLTEAGQDIERQQELSPWSQRLVLCWEDHLVGLLADPPD